MIKVGLPVYNCLDRLPSIVKKIDSNSNLSKKIYIFDNTQEEQLTEQCKQIFQKLHATYLRHSENIGMIENDVFARTYLSQFNHVILHDDDILEQNYFQELHNSFKSSDAVLVIPGCQRFLEGKLWYVYDNPNYTQDDVYLRLRQVLLDSIYKPNSSEQFLYGLFRAHVFPKEMLWGRYRSIDILLLHVASRGKVISAPRAVIKKHTNEENIKKYSEHSYIKGTWLDAFPLALRIRLAYSLRASGVVLRLNTMKIQQRLRLTILIWFHTVVAILSKLIYKLIK